MRTLEDQVGIMFPGDGDAAVQLDVSLAIAVSESLHQVFASEASWPSSAESFAAAQAAAREVVRAVSSRTCRSAMRCLSA